MGFIPDEQQVELTAQKPQGEDVVTPSRSIPEFLKREAGLIAREAITPATVGGAVAGIAGAPFEVAAPAARVGASGAFLADIGAKVYNSLVAQGDEKKKVPELSAVLEDIKNQIGLPKPETPFERIQSKVVGTTAEMVPLLAGGQLMAGAQNLPKLAKVGEFIAASPGVQAAAGAVGSALSSTAKEMGMQDELGQTAVGLAGSLATPSLARMGQVALTARKMGVAAPIALASGLGGITEFSKNLALNALRGFRSQEELAKNIALYEKAGTTPTLAQAVERPLMQAIETTTGRFPSGLATMREKGLAQQAEVGKRVEELRAQISRVTEPVEAGRAVQKGFTEVFVPRARQAQKNLYGAFDAYMPERMPVDSDNTEKVLNEMVNRISNAAPSLQKEFANTKLSSILNGIYETRQMNAQGKIPYNVLKDLRTSVGEKLATVDLTPDVTKVQYQRFYGAITKDMEAAAAKQGPEALARFRVANEFTRKFHETMDNVQSLIMDKNPEDVYLAIVGGARNGPTRLKEIFDVVPPDARRAVSSAFIARMGKAVPGLQDPTGDVFSTAKFLQNYATLDPEAKKILIGGFGKKFENDLETVAKVANKIRESNAILANPSGTAGAVVTPATITSGAGSLAAGKFGFLSGIIGTLVGANQAARLYTNPQFVNWLATNKNTPISGTSAALATLMKIYEKSGDEDIKELHDAVRDNAIEQEIIKK
ncbi:MAG: hypothetical protein EBT26_01885 [Microbacteriaceae bacterium]|nr:hypothetical protein [Microbacteriaceae bacterium]